MVRRGLSLLFRRGGRLTGEHGVHVPCLRCTLQLRLLPRGCRHEACVERLEGESHGSSKPPRDDRQVTRARTVQRPQPRVEAAERRRGRAHTGLREATQDPGGGLRELRQELHHSENRQRRRQAPQPEEVPRHGKRHHGDPGTNPRPLEAGRRNAGPSEQQQRRGPDADECPRNDQHGGTRKETVEEPAGTADDPDPLPYGGNAGDVPGPAGVAEQRPKQRSLHAQESESEEVVR